MCGLKRILERLPKYGSVVTSFVGVWIETNLPIDYFTAVLVTSFVGVWIETPLGEEPLLNLGVTSFVGVWIET